MIERMIDEFREKYSYIKIEEKIIDITGCFHDDAGRYDGPKSYGENPVVLAYGVRGAPFESKYVIEDGRIVRKKGYPIIKKFDDNTKVLTFLCVYDLRNTSFHEVRDSVYYAPDESGIQGYSHQNLERIESALKDAYSDFDPEKDTAFIFAGGKEVYDRLKLNRIWMSQMISHGGKMLDIMDDVESYHMEKVFPEEVLSGNKEAIAKRSYMYGKPIHAPESIKFLERKIEAYRREK